MQTVPSGEEMAPYAQPTNHTYLESVHYHQSVGVEGVYLTMKHSHSQMRLPSFCQLGDTIVTLTNETNANITVSLHQ